MTDTLKVWQQHGHEFKHKGHRIFYRLEGQGEPLLLIHGFPTASWDWHKIYDDLCQRFTVIAPDLIGFGFSAKPQSYDYSLFDQADLMESLLDHLGVTSVNIFCHDYGDTVGQELLARLIENQAKSKSYLDIKSVCLLNGGLFPESIKPRLIQKLLLSKIGVLLNPLLTKRRLRSNFNSIFGRNTQPSDLEIGEFYDLINNNNGKAIMHKLIQYMKEREENRKRWTGALRDSSVPLRLIIGLSDPISGRHIADRFEQVVNGSDLIRLENVGHYPQTERPDLVLHHYLDFINKIS